MDTIPFHHSCTVSVRNLPETFVSRADKELICPSVPSSQHHYRRDNTEQRFHPMALRHDVVRSSFGATCDVWEWERAVTVSLWWTEAICWLTLLWTVDWYNSYCLSGEFGALENKIWLNHGGKSTNSFLTYEEVAIQQRKKISWFQKHQV